MEMEEYRRVNAEINEKAKKSGLKNAWSHKMSLILERPALLMPEPEAWEVEYNEWKAKYQEPILAQIPDIQPLLDEDPAKKSDGGDAAYTKLTEAELAAMDDEQRERALRAEEIALAAKEEATVQKGSRITQADRTNDRTSLLRALDQKLYLVVKKNRKDHPWQFPQVPLPVDVTNETKQLRDFAGEGVTAAVGPSCRTWMTGNAPCGFYTYPFSQDTQKSLDTYGAKLFFYRGYYIKGDVVRPSRYVEHAWVTKTELKEYIQDETLYKYLDGVLI
jgi:large subunit ribosomal protein L46